MIVKIKPRRYPALSIRSAKALINSLAEHNLKLDTKIWRTIVWELCAAVERELSHNSPLLDDCLEIVSFADKILTEKVGV